MGGLVGLWGSSVTQTGHWVKMGCCLPGRSDAAIAGNVWGRLDAPFWEARRLLIGGRPDRPDGGHEATSKQLSSLHNGGMVFGLYLNMFQAVSFS